MKDHRDAPGTMKCGHPLAARKITPAKDGNLVTSCWACEVEWEIKHPWVKR